MRWVGKGGGGRENFPTSRLLFGKVFDRPFNPLPFGRSGKAEKHKKGGRVPRFLRETRTAVGFLTVKVFLYRFLFWFSEDLFLFFLWRLFNSISSWLHRQWFWYTFMLLQVFTFNIPIYDTILSAMFEKPFLRYVCAYICTCVHAVHMHIWCVFVKH